MTEVSASNDDREPRRNALILTAAGAVGGSAPAMPFRSAASRAPICSGRDKSLATLAASASSSSAERSAPSLPPC